MTQISITVEAPALTEAINHLADAIKAGCSQQDYAESLVDAETLEHLEQAAQIISTIATPDPEPKADPAPAAPATPAANQVPQVQTATPAAVTPAPAPVAPAPAPAPVQKTYTLDELSLASAELIDNGKMQQIMAIIQKYGVPAINLLRPDQYESYAADIRAIGGKI